MLFAGGATLLAADDVNGGVAGRSVKPASDNGASRETAGVSCEGGEDFLRDIGRVVGVAPEAAEGGGVNRVKVTTHQLGEGSFRTGVSVKTEQFGISRHGFVS